MIVNEINEHKYIGQSKNIFKRFNYHHKTDYLNKNNCCYNTKLYEAMRKYKIENFNVIILELCEENKLNEREIYYIKKFDTFKNGYNSTEGGQALSEKLFSNETKKKRIATAKQNKSFNDANHPGQN